MSSPVDVLQRFRILSVQLALVLTAGAAAAAYGLGGRDAAFGLIMMALASIITFWLKSRQFERVAQRSNNALRSASYTWTAIQMAVFAVIGVRAYLLDTETLHGLYGAIVGLFIINGAVAFLGMTGLDLKGTAGAAKKD